MKRDPINKIKDERGKSQQTPKKNNYKEYYGQLYANKLSNLKKWVNS